MFNILDYAYQNDVIMKNPCNGCNGMVKSDIGKPTQKKEALTLERQKRFVKGIVGNTYEYQYKFLLQTILGHSNISITMNLYVHTTEDEKHKEIEKIAASLKVV